MVQMLRVGNHITLGHAGCPTICETPTSRKVYLNGERVVLSSDPFVPHCFVNVAPANLALHPTNLLGTPSKLLVEGRFIGIELDKLSCTDIVFVTKPSRVGLAESHLAPPISAPVNDPNVTNPRNDHEVYINGWPVVIYPNYPVQTLPIFIRYLRAEGRFGDIYYQYKEPCFNRGFGLLNSIRPLDGYTPVRVDPPGDGLGNSYEVRNLIGSPMFNRVGGCSNLPAWARGLEQPIGAQIKIREIQFIKTRVDDQGNTTLALNHSMDLTSRLPLLDIGALNTDFIIQLIKEAHQQTSQGNVGSLIFNGTQFNTELRTNQIRVVYQTGITLGGSSIFPESRPLEEVQPGSGNQIDRKYDNQQNIIIPLVLFPSVVC